MMGLKPARPAILIPASSLSPLGEPRGSVGHIRPPSSSGLGYQVLILETGVRVPVGVLKHEPRRLKNRRGFFVFNGMFDPARGRRYRSPRERRRSSCRQRCFQSGHPS